MNNQNNALTKIGSSITGPSTWTFGPSDVCPDPSKVLAGSLQEVANTVVAVWHLRDYVAVNPLQGYTSGSLYEAQGKLRQISDAEVLPPLSLFRDRFQQGFLGREHILEAFEELNEEENSWSLELSDVMEAVTGGSTQDPDVEQERVECITDMVDRLESTEWGRFVRGEFGKYCSDYYDEGIAIWLGRQKDRSLYTFWKQGCLKDLSCTLAGLNWIREQVEDLSNNEKEALLQLLLHLQIPEGYWTPYLSRLVHTVPGWFSWALRMDSKQGAPSGLGTHFTSMLVMRLAYEAGLSRIQNLRVDWRSQYASWLKRNEGFVTLSTGKEMAIRYLLQRAMEVAYRRPLLNELAERAVLRKARKQRPPIEAVFCMDVRSERMRRHLELADPSIRTAGFAGFFGLAFQLEEESSGGLRPHAPALLDPQLRLKPEPSKPGNSTLGALLEGSSARIRKSPSGSFGFIETGGWMYLLELIRRSLKRNKPAAKKDCCAHPDQLHDASSKPVSLCEKVDLAESILQGLSLGSQTGKLYVFCGHESESANNPLKASLDCGACGGHGGAWNASLAASLLNDPDVRRELTHRGHELPDDIYFVSAVHETVEDRVRILGKDSIPASHRELVAQFEGALDSAGTQCREERALSLGVRSGRELLGRSLDWSEVRPEWGLVGNAALIVGPSEWVSHLDLKGRTFLHEYDEAKDHAGVMLEKILAGPMVVAHWINMQYLVSSVDPVHFGSGTKTIHDVCGKFGILSGLEGDLRVGLPQQSVGKGDQPDQDALRLLVAVRASCETLDQVLERQPALAPLCRQGWISLVSVRASGVYRMDRNGDWQSLPTDVPSTRPFQPVQEAR